MDLFFTVLGALFSLEHFLFLMAGILLGLTVGILPGLGGTTALAILLPFVSAFEPTSALALMIGVLAPTTTSDTFPAVLIGVPGTAGSQATVLDGYPMAKRGEAARALSAAFLSSMIGGVWGAIILTFAIVFAKPLILAVGFGEQFLLIVLALIMVGALTGANLVKGLASCLIGLVLGAVGLAQITAEPRLTFGTLYLTEGVPLVVVGMGLFAIPEIVSLLQSKASITEKLNLSGQWIRGFRDVAANWFLVFRCSTIGVIVGALPGLGGTVVDWIAYSHLRQTARDTTNIGKGDIRGVIAPESANNAKEGGALIPTILFGIPGSGNKVLLLGGFLLVGIEPGIEMVTTQLDLTYTIIWSLAVANIIGAGICIILAGPMSRITTVPYFILAPVLIALIFFASYQVGRDWNNFAGLMVFGLLGVIMKSYGWSRPALLIGFFLSSKIELLSYQTSAVYGMSFLWRTGSLI
ncbi:MAG: tripartite tricarboxylate transporter permease, partial [Roseovarius sp.]